MKIAIIGIGAIAEFQLQALAHLNDLTLVGGYDIQSERAKLLPPTAVFYPNLDALLAECEADLFLLSTPNLTHYPLGKRGWNWGALYCWKNPAARQKLNWRICSVQLKNIISFFLLPCMLLTAGK